MPFENDKDAINARRAELLKNPKAGQKETARFAGSGQTIGTVNIDENQLRNAVQNLFNKGKQPTMANSNNLTLDTSKDVVDAIKAGKLKKSEAVAYAEHFNLVQADKIDDLTPSIALTLLEQDSNEDSILENEVTAQVVTPNETYVKDGEQVKHEDQPKPMGKVVTPDSIIRHDTGDNASTVNTAKPQDKYPEPMGSINPKKIMPNNGAGKSDVNTAKPEDKKNTPEHVNMKISNTVNGANDKSTVNTAKPEDHPEPNKLPDIDLNNDQPPGNGGGDKASTVNTAKPEDERGNPEKSPINPKGMPTTGQMVEDGGMPPMPPMPKPDMGKDIDKDMDSLDKDIDKDFGGDKKGPPHGDHGKKDHMAPAEEIDKALELITKVTELLEGMEAPVKRKEVKKKKSPEGGGDGPKDEKKDDKPEGDKGEKKDSPFPSKDKPKEDKKDDKPSIMPAIMGYKVEFIDDKKSPMDSYYVVSLNDKSLFSVNARQAAVVQTSVKDELTLDQFKSVQYKDLLTNELNAQGAKHVFKEVFAGKGVVADVPTPPSGGEGAPPPAAGGLPSDKFTPPAKDMNAAPAVEDKIGNDAATKHSHVDLILEMLADAIANSPDGTTCEEAVDQLGEIFADESKKRQFLGRLSEKVEQKKKDQSVDTVPNGMADMKENAAPKPEEMKAENDSLKAAILKIHPKVIALAKENAELKEFKLQHEKNQILKARATATKKVAAKKAECGLIDETDIDSETLRLAKLSNADLEKEVKELENSIKIANKMNKSIDCNSVEGKEVIANKEVLASIPSQMENQVVGSKANKFPWSKGMFQGY